METLRDAKIGSTVTVKKLSGEGAVKREMNSAKWTAFAISYQCIFAYAVSLIIYQFGLLFTGRVNAAGLIFAILVLGIIVYMLARPYTNSVLKTF